VAASDACRSSLLCATASQRRASRPRHQLRSARVRPSRARARRSNVRPRLAPLELPHRPPRRSRSSAQSPPARCTRVTQCTTAPRTLLPRSALHLERASPPRASLQPPQTPMRGALRSSASHHPHNAPPRRMPHRRCAVQQPSLCPRHNRVEMKRWLPCRRTAALSSRTSEHSPCRFAPRPTRQRLPRRRARQRAQTESQLERARQRAASSALPLL
jgi:hypothetical protein